MVHAISMKNPRDLAMVGLGFFLGMIFCYFLMAGVYINSVTIATNQPPAGGFAQTFMKPTAPLNLPTPEQIRFQSAPMEWKTQPPAVWDRPTLEGYGQPLLDFRYKLPE
jgi:hypothetical protein